MPEPTLSVSIISLNEADRIGRTLQSVRGLADEIVVVDGGSTDSTAEIARSFGAKVYEEEWKGFAGQKNSCLKKCTGDWILCLDSDEEITPLLAEEIKKTMRVNGCCGYALSRKTFYLGKLLKRSWQPDNRVRLVKRTACPRWEGAVVHEALNVDGNTGLLKNYMVHYSYRNLTDHMAKTIKYAELSAKSYYEKGRKFSPFKLAFSPAFAFIGMYVLHRAFLDGVRGLIASFSAFVYSFLKYFYLWDLCRKEKAGGDDGR